MYLSNKSNRFVMSFEPNKMYILLTELNVFDMSEMIKIVK